MADAMSAAPEQSLPRQFARWSDLMAAYRFLNNPRVDPAALIEPHCRLTREHCAEHEIVLCVQDTTWLDYTHHPSTSGLGKIPGKNGHGLLQHAAVAVLPSGQILGLLHSGWMKRVEKPEGETRSERLQRWRESELWADAVAGVGDPPGQTRFITVTDRGGDCFETFAACEQYGHGYVIRAQHNRSVNQGRTSLWPFMQNQPVATELTIDVPSRQSHHRVASRKARQAKVSVRFSRVTLDAPKQDPRFEEPRTLYAVYVREENPPEHIKEPIEWLLLTSEPVESLDDGLRIIGWYRQRWVIEELHRVEKEGCGLEEAQFDHGDDLMRLAAIVCVIAVRLIQLRDLADDMNVTDPCGRAGDRQRTGDRQRKCISESPEALQRLVPWLWITAVARTGSDPVDPATLSPRQFWRRLAMKGGWLARKCDGRPGWKTIWRGWTDFTLIVQGLQLAQHHRCV